MTHSGIPQHTVVLGGFHTYVALSCPADQQEPVTTLVHRELPAVVGCNTTTKDMYSEIYSIVTEFNTHCCSTQKHKRLPWHTLSTPACQGGAMPSCRLQYCATLLSCITARQQRPHLYQHFSSSNGWQRTALAYSKQRASPVANTLSSTASSSVCHSFSTTFHSLPLPTHSPPHAVQNTHCWPDCRAACYTCTHTDCKH